MSDVLVLYFSRTAYCAHSIILLRIYSTTQYSCVRGTEAVFEEKFLCDSAKLDSIRPDSVEPALDFAVEFATLSQIECRSIWKLASAKHGRMKWKYHSVFHLYLVDIAA